MRHLIADPASNPKHIHIRRMLNVLTKWCVCDNTQMFTMAIIRNDVESGGGGMGL